MFLMYKVLPTHSSTADHHLVSAVPHPVPSDSTKLGQLRDGANTIPIFSVRKQTFTMIRNLLGATVQELSGTEVAVQAGGGLTDNL